MKAIRSSLVIRPIILATVFGGAVLASGGRASAQEPPASPPPPPVFSGSGNGIGVGASAFLSGVAGALVNYDQSTWDIEGILGFADRRTGGPNSANQTTLRVGARGWYHLHRGSSSDFSIGGGIGVDHFTGAGPASTATLIEPGVRARAFITPNVAAFAVLGLSVVLGDNDNNNVGVGIGTQALFGGGFTYYFK